VFSLLYRNLTVAYLCWLGWLELYGMMVSKCWFPVYGKFPVSGCSVDGNVEEV